MKKRHSTGFGKANLIPKKNTHVTALMKQPWWKNWLSYFTEIILEIGSTDLNPDLQLGLKKGRYCLSTPNAIYSFGDLYNNFSKSFQIIKITEEEVKDVLVLGFGLGSIPYMLEKVFHKKCTFVGVEADEMIALWAKQYVVDELDSAVQMNITNAIIFVELCNQKFDLIAMDIFIDDKIPSEFEGISFLENLKSLLNEDGILMYNRLALNGLAKDRTESFFNNEFKSVFPEGRYLDVGGNWMLLNH